MITKHEAMTEREFHLGCSRSIGLRGEVKHHAIIWRRNGQTKTYVTRPDDFLVPIKYGLSQYGYLTPRNADQFVAGSTCPVCHPGTIACDDCQGHGFVVEPTVPCQRCAGTGTLAAGADFDEFVDSYMADINAHEAKG